MTTTTSPISRQPTKLDYSSPTQFKFVIDQIPKVEFFTTSANLPGISLGEIEMQTPFKNIPLLGDRLTYDNLTVSSEGFRVITDVLEDLFEQFGFVRFPDKNNLEAVTELDAKLETVFSETRIDLVQAFNEAMERSQEEQEESDRLDARLGGAIHK